MDEPIRIAMWSGPRALSTAMMRAWENRPDCIVVDEPLYGAFLADSGLDHPMRDEVIATMECDAAKAGASMAVLGGAPVIYQKHMSHHLLPTMPREWIGSLRNAFLIRDPAKVLASYDQKRAAPTLADIGIAQQAELFDHACERLGHAPPVIDAEAVQSAPKAALKLLCRALNVPFAESMLTWPEGPRESDGIWASHWYDSVWRTTGFAPPSDRKAELTSPLKALADQARPLYDKLAQHQLKPTC